MTALIGVGVTSVLALGIASAVVSGMDGMSHMRNVALAEDVTALVSGMMSDANYCALHFQNRKVDLKKIPFVIASDIKFMDVKSDGDLGKNVILGAHQKYQNILEILSMSLAVSTSLGGGKYLGSIDLTLKGNTGYGLYFNRNIPMMINVSVDKDGNASLTGCSRFAEGSQSFGGGVAGGNVPIMVSKEIRLQSWSGSGVDNPYAPYGNPISSRMPVEFYYRFCASLNGECDVMSSGVSCDSKKYTGWRVPTVDELALFTGTKTGTKALDDPSIGRGGSVGLFTRTPQEFRPAYNSHEAQFNYNAPQGFKSFDLESGVWFAETGTNLRCVR